MDFKDTTIIHKQIEIFYKELFNVNFQIKNSIELNNSITYSYYIDEKDAINL
jgi:hypothetical protein